MPVYILYTLCMSKTIYFYMFVDTYIDTRVQYVYINVHMNLHI